MASSRPFLQVMALPSETGSPAHSPALSAVPAGWVAVSLGHATASNQESWTHAAQHAKRSPGSTKTPRPSAPGHCSIQPALQRSALPLRKLGRVLCVLLVSALPANEPLSNFSRRTETLCNSAGVCAWLACATTHTVSFTKSKPCSDQETNIQSAMGSL